MTIGFVWWDVDPVLVDTGFFSIRYYSLFFGAGIFIAGLCAYYMLKKQGMSFDLFSTFFCYIFFGTVIGARLGHCLFYEPAYYLTHPLEIFLPVEFVDGQLEIIGYRGLASHGGGAGILIALWLFCRRYNFRMLYLLDYMAITGPLAAGMIRLGNLMNSEIIGEVTTVPWAFYFLQVDNQPRHPAQLYEALAYFLLFAVNTILYKRKKNYPEGFFIGLTLLWIFTYRFFIEFLKMNQVGFEDQFLLNMGQLLSLPYIFAGIYFMFIHPRLKNVVKV